MLRNKSLTELRGIAQSFGIPVDFSKDAVQLAQAIEAKQKDMVPKPEAPARPVDGRLTYKSPSRRTSKTEIVEVLAPYVDRGLRLEFPDDDSWTMALGNKNDSGNIRIPLRVVVNCAERLFK